MERDKVAALRRVAIVLSSLPDATARRLLANLESDQQRAVRAAISHLDDVDPLERRRALDGFTASIRQGRSSLAGQNDAAEIVLSRVALHRDDARMQNQSHGNPANDWDDSSSSQTPAFAFLSTVDDDAIAHRIKDEHPQTIATILASISPRQAARLLAKLGVVARTETMRRLAKMDTPSPEVVDEIAAQLKQKLIHVRNSNGGTATAQANLGNNAYGSYSAGQTRSAGQAALQAILAEMNHTNGHASSGSTYGDESAVVGRSERQPIGEDSPNILPLSNSARGGDRFSQPGAAGDSPVSQEQSADASRFINAKPKRPVKSTADIHSQLISTPPAKLREALASVDGRQAILALCGLPKSTAEAVLSDLPRRQAKQIRQQIASLGMLELREIDAAKEAVAQAINPPSNRSSTSVAAGPTATSSTTLAAA